MSKKVLVAVSGGVDSSTALHLLKEQGYEVIAGHMKLWDYDEVGGDIYRDGRCCSIESINDLHQVCDIMSIPFYVFNFVDQFREKIIDNFISEYRAGRTPNPCVICNSQIKWADLLGKALEIGCDYVASGHYAKVEFNTTRQRYIIRCGVDDTRDQSYFLWGLTQEALSRTLLPLGKYKKTEIREIARKYNIRTSDKPESRENCFIADDNYPRFLKEWEEKQGRGFKPGDIVNESGDVIGRHNGIAFYTVGQRRGMGISHPTPLYVKEIDAENNRIMVGDDKSLFSKNMKVRSINWIAFEKAPDSFTARVKIRYLHKAAPARVIPGDNNTATILFDSDQRAITPGQSAVFYENHIVLGGGIIE